MGSQKITVGLGSRMSVARLLLRCLVQGQYRDATRLAGSLLGSLKLRLLMRDLFPLQYLTWEWQRLGRVPRFTSGRRTMVDRRCKVTPGQVAWIRKHDYITMRHLACFCGLSVSTVHQILRGNYWKD